MDVILPPGVWVDLYAATGILTTLPLNAINLTPNDVRLTSTDIEPDGSTNHVPLLFGRGTGVNDATDPGAWAMCVGGGAVNVTDAS